MTVRELVPVGTKVKLHPSGERGIVEREYTIIEVYEHFAVAEDKFGIRQCVLNADLVQMGLAKW